MRTLDYFVSESRNGGYRGRRRYIFIACHGGCRGRRSLGGVQRGNAQMELCARHRLESDAALIGIDVPDLYNRRCHAADVERYGVDFRPALFGRGCYVIAANLEGPLELLRNSRSRRTRKACPHRLAATQCTDSSNDQRWRAKRVSGYSERQWRIVNPIQG